MLKKIHDHLCVKVNNLYMLYLCLKFTVEDLNFTERMIIWCHIGLIFLSITLIRSLAIQHLNPGLNFLL